MLNCFHFFGNKLIKTSQASSNISSLAWRLEHGLGLQTGVVSIYVIGSFFQLQQSDIEMTTHTHILDSLKLLLLISELSS